MPTPSTRSAMSPLTTSSSPCTPRTRIEVDERFNPVRTSPIDEQLRSGIALREVDLDLAFTDLDPVDGAVATLTAPDGPAASPLTQDEQHHWLQIFTTRSYPGTSLAVRDRADDRADERVGHGRRPALGRARRGVDRVVGRPRGAVTPAPKQVNRWRPLPRRRARGGFGLP